MCFLYHYVPFNSLPRVPSSGQGGGFCNPRPNFLSKFSTPGICFFHQIPNLRPPIFSKIANFLLFFIHKTAKFSIAAHSNVLFLVILAKLWLKNEKSDQYCIFK